MRHEVFLHVADPREWTTAFRADVRLVSDPPEWLSTKHVVQHALCVAVDEAVLLQIAVACELPVTFQTAVGLLHGAGIHLHRDVFQALFTAIHSLEIINIILNHSRTFIFQPLLRNGSTCDGPDFQLL